MGGWELGHQEEEQLANGLVHHRYLEAIVFLLVRDGVDPCQLRIFLNVATATIYNGAKQVLGIFIQAVTIKIYFTYKG